MTSEAHCCIFLIGFMGAGKSTVGRTLADCLQWRFVDLDQVIEQRAGKTITEIFAEQGEEAFRDLESLALSDLRKMPRSVVATGGGLIGRDENWRLMRSTGTVVYLDVPWEQLQERIKYGQGRPLAAGVEAEQRLRALFERRLPLYSQADWVICCDDKNPDELAALISAKLENADFFQSCREG